MPGIHTKDLNVAPSVTPDTLVPVSEEGTNELYKTTVNDIRGLVVPPSRCKVYLSLNYSITLSWETLPLDTIEYDTGSNWNSSEHRYEFPEDGYYMISFLCRFITGATEWNEYNAVVYTLTTNIGEFYYYRADPRWYLPYSGWTNSEWPSKPETFVYQANAGGWLKVRIYKYQASNTITPYVISGLITGTTLTILKLV